MTEDDKILFGKYKGCCIKSVPVSYLARISYDTSVKDRQPELFDWLQQNAKRLHEQSGITMPVKKVRMVEIIKPDEPIRPCFKFMYASEEQAKKELREIRKKYSQNPHKNGIPVRAYQCNNCRGWHLTSRP